MLRNLNTTLRGNGETLQVSKEGADILQESQSNNSMWYLLDKVENVNLVHFGK